MSTLKTRRPTGKPSWPIILLAGAEKAGKSWACAVASGSELVGRTIWVGVGEDDPDEYGAIPGADFEIVEHDGNYRSILDAVTAAVSEPQGDLPTLVVVDSMTRIWELITDDVQQLANARARAKAEKYNKPIPAEDVQITMDLWNLAKDRWDHIIDALRAHQGPVLVTARLEQVTIMDAKGLPTSEKEWKVKANKSLPFDVGAIIELPQRGEAWIRGVRSARLQLEERTRIPRFTVDGFWQRLGLAEVETGERRHSSAKATRGDSAAPTAAVNPDPARDWIAEAQQATTREELLAIYRSAEAAGAATKDNPLGRQLAQIAASAGLAKEPEVKAA